MDIKSQLDELFDPKIEVIEDPKPTQKPIQEDFEIEGLDELFGIKSEVEEIVEEVIPEPIKEEASYEPIDLNAYVTDDFVDLLIEASRKGEVELVELKEEVAPEPKIESESIKPRTLMDDYSDTLGAISKKLKVEDLVTEEDRLNSLETQLIQVRQLFREATMVSGIGQGGDGQTPGSGVVKAKDLDDVNLDGIQLGDQLVWDGNQFVPGSGDTRPPIIGDLPPTEHPDFIAPDNNLKEGDNWIDENGSLHIYYDGQWNKVSVYSDQVLPSVDAPYTIETPNGESFNNQKEYNEWLYTRTDRKPILSSSAPSIHPDFPADPLRIGDYWIDDNSHLYYWDNNAWLPVSAGAGRPPIFSDEEPAEHPDFSPPDNELQTGDTWYDTDNSFKVSIYDGTQWVSVTPDRKETFARFYQYVEPSTFNSGNDNTCTFVTTGSTIDTITNVKFSGNDQQGKIRYLYNINEDILIEDERNGAYAALRVVKINDEGDYDVELEHRNGYGGLDIGQTYAFGSTADHGAIPDIGDDSQQPGTLDDRYVNTTGGDSMQGPLTISGGRTDDGDGIVSTLKALNIDSAQQSALHLNWNGNTKLYIGKDQVTIADDLKFSQNGTSIKSNTDSEVFRINSNGAFYLGNYSSDDHITTKKDAEALVFDDITDDTTNKFVKRTGDTMTGGLSIDGELQVLDGKGFRVNYPDDENRGAMVRVQPGQDNIVLKASTINTNGTAGSLGGRAGLEIQVHDNKPLAISHSGSYQETIAVYGYDPDSSGGRKKQLTISAKGNVFTEGQVDAKSFVRGSELRSTKLTSGQSSNLEIHRGSGANEERKMLIGTDSVNFDVDIKLVDPNHKDIVVQNGTKLYAGSGEIITFGGDGAFYRGNITQDDHLVNKGYADSLVEDGAFLPLSGGTLTGDLSLENSKINFKDFTSDRIAIQARRALDQDMTLLNLLNNNSNGSTESRFYNIKLQGNTFYNGLRIKGSSNASTTFWEIRAGSGEMKFYSQTDFQNKPIQKVGDAIEDTDAVNFGQVKSYVEDNKGVDPGSQVVKTDGSVSVDLGGFYLSGGNLYVRVS